MKESDIGGVVVPIVTPITEAGEMDFRGLESVTEWLVGKGVHGIFVAGSTGRFSHFSPRQNADACRSVVETVSGRAKVFGGASDSGLFRVLENAEMMAEAGADVVVTTGPYYLPCTLQEAERDLTKIADKSPVPVVYYNIPSLVGYAMRVEWLGEIADHVNVAGCKDSSDDLPFHLDLLKRTREKDFKVFMGKELILAEALKNGAAGIVVSFAHVAPELIVDMFEQAGKGNWSAVDSLQNELKAVVGAAFKRRPAKRDSESTGGRTFTSLMTYLEGELDRQGVKVRLCL